MRVGVVILLLVAASCGRLKDPDPEVERIKERIRAILPDVEAALGDSIRGRIHVSVVSRAELAKRSPQLWPRDHDDSESELDTRSLFPTTALAVAAPNHIYICPENFRLLKQRRPELETVLERDFLDLVLAHELVHLYQEQKWSEPPNESRSDDGYAAFRAVVEGHAEYVMRAVSEQRGLREAMRDHDGMYEFRPKAEWDEGILHWRRIANAWSHYAGGERFFGRLVDRLGYRSAFRRVSNGMPRSLREVAEPERYIARRSAWTEPLMTRVLEFLAGESDDKPTTFAVLVPVLERELALIDAESRAAALAAFEDGKGVVVMLREKVTIVYMYATKDEEAARTFERVHRARLRREVELRRKYSPFRLAEARITEGPTGFRIDGEMEWPSEWLRYQHLVRRAGRFVFDISSWGEFSPIERLARRIIEVALPGSEWGKRWRDARVNPKRHLRDLDHDVRLAAIRALPIRQPIPATDKDWEVRWTISTMGDDEQMFAALSDPDPRVRVLACEEVHRLLKQQHVPWKIWWELLADDSVAVRRAAIRAVKWDWHDENPKDHLAALTHALDDANADVRAHAADGLSRLEETGPLVAKALRDAERIVRRAALRNMVIREKAWPETLEPLVELLREEDSRVDAAEALAMHAPQGAKRALPALRKALETDDLELRIAVAKALIAYGDESKPLHDAIDAALRDRKHASEAAECVEELGAKGARFVPLLVEMLDAPGSAERSSAANALAEIGPGAEAALPCLETATGDRDEGVRKAAHEAIKKIRGTAAAKRPPK